MASVSHERRLGALVSHVAATQEEVDVEVETQAAIVR